MFLGKVVLKLCSKFTGEHPCRSPISVKIFCKFFEIALRHGRSPVNLRHIFRPPLNGWFLKVAFGHLNLAMQWESRGGLYFIRKKRKKKKTKVDLRTCGTIGTTLTTWIVGKKTLSYVGKNVRNICWFAIWFSKKRDTHFWKVFQWKSVLLLLFGD